MSNNLKHLDKHFAFGDNWSEFADGITERMIANAESGLTELVPPDAIKDRNFLDLGSGSGLHSLAALTHGAKSVLAVDIDPMSVQTTRKVLSQHYDGDNWQCEELSVFDITAEKYGTFDIVYSWGVLHHTGDMCQAISQALDMVSPGGLCVLALYRKTKLCGFWKLEKKFYSGSGKIAQYITRKLYLALYRLRCLIRRESVKEEIRGYYKKRGMDFYSDVHDWLGGYPYESVTPEELKKHVDACGDFELIHYVDSKSTANSVAHIGIFGTGCDEFVFQRRG